MDGAKAKKRSRSDKKITISCYSGYFCDQHVYVLQPHFIDFISYGDFDFICYHLAWRDYSNARKNGAFVRNQLPVGSLAVELQQPSLLNAKTH